MNCLVTGATGFIGNAITKRLAKDGNVVYALIHNKKPVTIEKNVEYINCDLTKPSTLKNLPNKIDIVFHCAAIVKDYGPKDQFYNVNVEGTKNLVHACKNYKLKRFLFISHIGDELENKHSFYNTTKKIAEKYLIEKYQKDGFPVVIIIPGNVYGPGATTWVLRPLESIRANKIALINRGQGIFLHTYIDNLVDALISAMNEPKAIGQTINITDGDHTITWGRYLNDLANIIGKKPIKRNFSKKTGMMIAKTMMYLYKIFNFKPWVTPLAVSIFSNDKTISIKQAEEILNYKPKINYETGMKKVEEWIKQEGLIF